MAFLIFFYIVNVIKAQGLPPPSLTVTPSVIRERDSVQLNCLPPSPVSQCYFYIGRVENVRLYSCQKTLTGTDVMQWAGESSLTEVKVLCYYAVQDNQLHGPSSHSRPASLTIQEMTPHTGTVASLGVPLKTQKPVIRVDCGENVDITCTFRGAATSNTSCMFYIGKEFKPFLTTTIWRMKPSARKQYCKGFVREDNLLRYLHFVRLKVVSCDYSHGTTIKSPRSDGHNLTCLMSANPHIPSNAIVKPTDDSTKCTFIVSSTVSPTDLNSACTVQPSSTTVKPTTAESLSGVYATPTSSDLFAFSSTNLTVLVNTTTMPTDLNPSSTVLPSNTVKPTLAGSLSESAILTSSVLLRLVFGLAFCGVIVGVILIGLTTAFTPWRIKRKSSKRPQIGRVDHLNDDSLSMGVVNNNRMAHFETTASYSLIESANSASTPYVGVVNNTSLALKGTSDTYSLITSVSNSGLALVQMNGHATASEDSKEYHFYHTITDNPVTSAHEDMRTLQTQ